MNKLKRKNQAGITLIALIITIIVLLILAVVAIRAVSDGGIIQHAKTSSDKHKIAQEEEEIRLALSEWKVQSNIPGYEGTFKDFMTQKLSGDNTLVSSVTGEGENLVITMKSTRAYDVTAAGAITLQEVTGGGEQTPPASGGDDVVTPPPAGGNGGGTTLTWTLTESTSEDNVTGVSVGDIVTASNGESFYVIKTPEASETTVKLLAKYNLKADGSEQDTGADNPCAFSSTNYWDPNNELAYPLANGKYPDLNDETTYPLGTATSAVKERLQAYSTTIGVSARLMTLEEVVALGGRISDCSTVSCPSFINTQIFWLGSALSSEFVFLVDGSCRSIVCNYWHNESFYGVRPVIEISISSIS